MIIIIIDSTPLTKAQQLTVYNGGRFAAETVLKTAEVAEKKPSFCTHTDDLITRAALYEHAMHLALIPFRSANAGMYRSYTTM